MCMLVDFMTLSPSPCCCLSKIEAYIQSHQKFINWTLSQLDLMETWNKYWRILCLNAKIFNGRYRPDEQQYYYIFWLIVFAGVSSCVIKIVFAAHRRSSERSTHSVSTNGAVVSVFGGLVEVEVPNAAEWKSLTVLLLLVNIYYEKYGAWPVEGHITNPTNNGWPKRQSVQNKTNVGRVQRAPNSNKHYSNHNYLMFACVEKNYIIFELAFV